MAEGILVVRTSAGRAPRSGEQIRIGTYEVLFFYRVLPLILDNDELQVAPTPAGPLLGLVGQAFIDRYIDEAEIAAFESGVGAWEFFVGSRDTRRDEEGGPIRLETIPELVARLEVEWATRKAAALAEWAAEYEFTGRRIVP